MDWPKTVDFDHPHYRKFTGDNACNPTLIPACVNEYEGEPGGNQDERGQERSRNLCEREGVRTCAMRAHRALHSPEVLDATGARCYSRRWSYGYMV